MMLTKHVNLEKFVFNLCSYLSCIIYVFVKKVI